MNKRHMTEQEIRTQFITPAIKNSGWTNAQVREEYTITKGRIIARGGTYEFLSIFPRFCSSFRTIC